MGCGARLAGGTPVSTPSRADFAAFDAADGLAGFRDRFVVDDENRIYADGNSLGRLPRATVEQLSAVTTEWGERLVTGWADWIELPGRVGDRLAALLGAQSGEVLAADSTTVNLYKLAGATVSVRAGAVLTDASEFPTDRYVLAGLAEQHDRELLLLESDPIEGVRPEDLAQACDGRDVALVCLSHVSYRSGALADMRAITEVAHNAGALVIWDLSHSAGAVPVRLGACGVDFAVGCSYKYLNAGPGSPAYLFVRSDLQEGLRSPIQGWFGQRDQFAMGTAYEPAPGIERFLAGTPPVLGLVAVAAGVELVLEAGDEALREKSVALNQAAITLHDAWLAPLGFELGSPRDPDRRGGHVSVRHLEAWRVCRGLIERDVVPDFRAPDSVRLGFPPLYSRFVDVWDAFDRFRALVESEDHLDVDPTPARVT